MDCMGSGGGHDHGSSKGGHSDHGGDGGSHESMDSDQSRHQDVTTVSQTVPPGIDAQAMSMIYSGYLEIQASLAGDDLISAKENAGGLRKKINAIPESPASGFLKKRFSARLLKMSRAGTLSEVRKDFIDLSYSMISLLEDGRYAGETMAMVFHCPMADGGKGANWLQQDSKVKNPFYGKNMATCGKSIKTISGGHQGY